MDEGLALMKALWTTDPVTFQTKLVEAEIQDMRMRPLPPQIPIWIGGNSPPALARAPRARLGPLAVEGRRGIFRAGKAAAPPRCRDIAASGQRRQRGKAPADRPARGLRRALRHDGWHGTRQTPEEAKYLVQTLRATRPGHDFTISLRTSWDGQDQDALKSRLEAYAEAGITHVMVEPTDRELEDWLRSVEKIAKAGNL